MQVRFPGAVLVFIGALALSGCQNSVRKQPGPIQIAQYTQIYVTDTGHQRVVRIDNMNGDNFTSMPMPPAQGTSVSHPDALHVNGGAFQVPSQLNGIYVGDDTQGKVYKWDAWGATNPSSFSMPTVGSTRAQPT